MFFLLHLLIIHLLQLHLPCKREVLLNGILQLQDDGRRRRCGLGKGTAASRWLEGSDGKLSSTDCTVSINTVVSGSAREGGEHGQWPVAG
jgi:hypothetical protein